MPKRKTLITVFIIIFLSGFLSISFIKNQYVVPVVMYHSVYPFATPNNRLAVSAEAFERQMRFLKDHRYNVITMESLAGLTSNKKTIPPKTVVITFDDGYKNNYTYAFPILKKYNLPAMIFVILNEVGRPQNDRLSWNEIYTMHNSGLISFGSHTLGPEPLVNIKSAEELRRQVFDSKEILEEKLGFKVTAFSYPEGKFNNQIRQLVVEAGYKTAVTTNPGKDFSNVDVFALKRLRISSTSDNLLVFWIETSGYYNFIREHRHK